MALGRATEEISRHACGESGENLATFFTQGLIPNISRWNCDGQKCLEIDDEAYK